MVSFAPGRYVTTTGERVRQDPSGAPILLADLDVLDSAETAECERALLRLAQAGLADQRGSYIQRQLERVESDYAMGKRSGSSGKPWTEEQYREAGIETLHLRLGLDDHEALDELAHAWGYEGRGSRGLAVKRAIAEAHARVVPQARRTLLREEPAEMSAVQTKAPPNNRSGGRKSDKKNEKAT